MRGIFLVLATALSACTAEPAPIGAAATDEFAGLAAGLPQSCVSVQPTSNLRVIDSSTLSYGTGQILYVNRLRAPCPRLTSLSTLVISVQGTHYCSGDHFRPVETGAVIPGPICILGDWVPYRRH